MISSFKSLSSSNKIEKLPKSSEDANEASSCVQSEAKFTIACSLFCGVIDFICDLKLFKAINWNYFGVAGSLVTILRSNNYDATLYVSNKKANLIRDILPGMLKDSFAAALPLLKKLWMNRMWIELTLQNKFINRTTIFACLILMWILYIRIFL